MRFIEHNLLADNRTVDQVVRFEEDFFTGSEIDTVPVAHHTFRSGGRWEWTERRQWTMSRDYPFLVRFSDGTYGIVHRDCLAAAMAALGRSLHEV